MKNHCQGNSRRSASVSSVAEMPSRFRGRYTFDTNSEQITKATKNGRRMPLSWRVAVRKVTIIGYAKVTTRLSELINMARANSRNRGEPAERARQPVKTRGK